MPLPEHLQAMAKALRDRVDGLPPQEQAPIFAALCIIRATVRALGEPGQIALAIAAAEFAAE
ncbi:MAG: hypothetical protein P4L11_13590 [Geothrix sp.]|nr:hypothetical protein [Geothrix sp.]